MTTVIGVKAGIAYSIFVCGGWLANSLLIKYGILNHIKFYSPMYGDLHSCDSWIWSYFMVAVLSFGASALISYKLTQAFKEKVDDLDKSLNISKSTSISLKHIALMQNDPWIVIDKKGTILDLKCDENQLLIKNEMLKNNLLESLPDLAKSNYEFTAQSVLSSQTFKKLQREEHFQTHSKGHHHPDTKTRQR